MQESVDYLHTHYKEQLELHRNDLALSESILTSWYAFDKYYTKIDESSAYVAAILLRPNRRRNYLQAVWHASWVNPGVERARKFWEARYRHVDVDSEDRGANDDEKGQELSKYQRWQRDVAAKQRRKGSGAQEEFDGFIHSALDSIGISVVEWWLEPSQQRSYPRLSCMALDVLAALAMSAEVERVFSGTRRIISWTRQDLEAATIEMLECLKHWQTSGLVDD